jgi:hypothetical protein
MISQLTPTILNFSSYRSTAVSKPKFGNSDGLAEYQTVFDELHGLVKKGMASTLAKDNALLGYRAICIGEDLIQIPKFYSIPIGTPQTDSDREILHYKGSRRKSFKRDGQVRHNSSTVTDGKRISLMEETINFLKPFIDILD